MRRLLVLLLVASSLGFVGRGGVPCGAVEAQPQCLVALLPGPTANTLDILEVTGGDVSTSAGELLLTTVSVDPSLTFREWLQGIFDNRVQHLDRELIYPEGTTVEAVREQNAFLMERSQVEAIVAAFTAMGRTDLFAGAEVGEVQDFSTASDGRLQAGDVIVEVEGSQIVRATDLTATLARFGEGDEVELAFERRGQPLTTTVTLVVPEGGDRALLGISVFDHLDLPVEIEIDAGEVGGPSAGLMFALAIIDSLTPDDLTAGRIIAGTGEIREDGTVVPIGGIQQKILGALTRFDEEGERLPSATVFLVPAANMAEARGAPVTEEILLVPVATLQDGLDALAALRQDQLPAGAVTLTP